MMCPAPRTAASPRLLRTLCALLLGASIAATAAAEPVAAEQVYVWRDSAGAVRFSPVVGTAAPADPARGGADSAPHSVVPVLRSCSDAACPTSARSDADARVRLDF